MASLGLRDAYLQVPVHPESRCYLRFCVGEEVFQFRALCFSLLTATHAFTRVMAPVSSIMHRHGFRILRYLDDWLVLGVSFQDLVRARDFLLWLCQELGVQVNLEKSSLTPTQTLDYLGMRLQTLPLRVFPTPKRVLKLASLVSEFASCPLQPLALWHQLLGVMSTLSSIVPGSCLRMRSLQLRLNSAGRLLLDSDSVFWDASCLEDLRWWSDKSQLLVGLPLGFSHPSLLLFTDASDSGWGASLEDDHMSGSWSLTCSQFSINHQELFAVLYGVQGFLPLLRQPARGQHHRLGLLAESVWHPFVTPQLGSAGHLASLRGSQGSVGAPVHSRASECAGGHPESSFIGPWVGMDPLFSSFLGPSSSVAGDNRPLCHFVEPSPSRLLLADGGSAVVRHGCDDAALGWSTGLCLPSLRPSPVRRREGLAASGVEAHVGGSVLASTPLVSGPSGASGGCPSVPSKLEGSTQTASLP